MQIINKTNKEFRLNQPRLADPTIIFLNDRKIYFSRAAVEHFNLVDGRKAHFLSDVDRLYFITNDDNAGFKLKYSTKGTLVINSMGLIRTLGLQFPGKISPGTVFQLKGMQTKINDSPAVEVLLSSRRITKSRKRK